MFYLLNLAILGQRPGSLFSTVHFCRTTIDSKIASYLKILTEKIWEMGPSALLHGGGGGGSLLWKACQQQLNMFWHRNDNVK